MQLGQCDYFQSHVQTSSNPESFRATGIFKDRYWQFFNNWHI